MLKLVFPGLFFLIFAGQAFSQVIINEIMFKPSDEEDTRDWIELYNKGGESVDISGWYLLDDDDKHDKFYFPEGTVIEPGAYLVLSEDIAAFTEINTGDINIIGEFTFGFGAGGDKVRIFDASGNLVNEVMYSSEAPWPQTDPAGGISIELIDHDYDNTKGESWKASNGLRGTPGEKNSPVLSVSYAELDAEISIYPLPAQNQINIEFDTAIPADMEIINNAGEVIYRRSYLADITQVDISGIASGNYYLKFISGNAVTVRKIVIAK